MIDALSNGGQQSDWRIRSLVVDIVNLCSGHDCWSFGHVKRQANFVAHNLAKWAFAENLSRNIPVSVIPDLIFTSVNPWFPP